MRMLVHVRFPHGKFNAAVRDGTVGAKVELILAETQAEAVYFTEYNGQRCAIMIVDVADPSRVPRIAEPWFLEFNADVEFHIAMTPADLNRAGLDDLGQKWG